MDSKKVKSITLHFPNTDDGTWVHYEVGKSDVTEIIERQYSPEPYCCRFYYDIFTEKGLIVSMHHFSTVEYFIS